MAAETPSPSPEKRARDTWEAILDAMRDGKPYGDRAERLLADAIRQTEADAIERCVAHFERLAEIVQTPADMVSDADKALYSESAEHFEPLGRSVLPNWTAIAAAIRALPLTKETNDAA